jgi:hypothetical protein
VKSTTSLRLIANLILVVAAISLACNMPGVTVSIATQPTADTPRPMPTTAPTATPLPTLSPQPTVTVTPTPTVTAEWPVVLFDDFSGPGGGWWTGEGSEPRGTRSMAIRDGRYRWELSAFDHYYLHGLPAMPAVSDFVLSVEADMVPGNEDGSCGLIFRQAATDSLLTFEVNEIGAFSVWMREPEGWSKVMGWDESSAILRDEPNRLMVVGEGTHFEFFINDEYVAELDDDRWPAGQVGVTATLNYGGLDGTFEFDNFELRAPPQSPEAQTEATEQAGPLAQRVQQLAADGVLTSAAGDYYPLPDYDSRMAKINYYEPLDTGYAPTNFIVRADAAWESASTTADWWISGCGFVYRYQGQYDHYAVYLGLDGTAYMLRYLNQDYTAMGNTYYGLVGVPAGEAELMLAVQGNKFTFFVNDKQVHQRTDSALRSGLLGYMLISGTNKDFGTRCTMTNSELWVLK